MPIKIAECEDTDMMRIFEITSLGFDRNEPAWDTYWPEHWTAAGRKAGGERMRKSRNNEPGEILGMAKWILFEGQGPEVAHSLPNVWNDPRDKEFAEKSLPLFHSKRNQAIARTAAHVLDLDVLAVDPAHQRKGVGTALLKWGIDKADELGLETIVESTRCGKGLYEKNGFKCLADVWWRVPGFEDKPVLGFYWMERPKMAEK